MNSIILIIFGSIGLLVTAYILYSKKTNTPMICPNTGCNDVVNSKYGKSFGFENTYVGIIFYIMILTCGMLQLSDRNVFKEDIVYYSVVGISIVSVLFSLYLTGVQAFVLKRWCYYCLASTACSIIILITLVV